MAVSNFFSSFNPSSSSSWNEGHPSSYERYKEESSPNIIPPYMNLIASHHNAYIIPSNDPSTTVVEIKDDTQLGYPKAEEMGEEQSDPDRQFTNAVDHNTTMGAVTLLAFLNLLGYIQSVLGGVGRKRRSLPNSPLGRREGAYPHRIPVSPAPSILQDIFSSLGKWGQRNWNTEQGEKVNAAESRIAAPLASKRATLGSLRSFFTNLGHRFKLASSVLSFLSNPDPLRVRRSTVSKRRPKRFTSEMNAWYNKLAGENYDVKTNNGRNIPNTDLLSTLMLGLGRQILGR